MADDNIRALLLAELREIHAAEQRVIQALPAFAETATSEPLRRAIERHLIETNDRIVRLDRIFEHLGEPAEGQVSMAVEGIVGEAQKALQGGLEPNVLDLALIAAMQKIAHYEIAGYGTMSAWSRLCDLHDVHGILEQSLEEQKAINALYTRIALSDIEFEQTDCAAG